MTQHRESGGAVVPLFRSTQSARPEPEAAANRASREVSSEFFGDDEPTVLRSRTELISAPDATDPLSRDPFDVADLTLVAELLPSSVAAPPPPPAPLPRPVTAPSAPPVTTPPSTSPSEGMAHKTPKEEKPSGQPLRAVMFLILGVLVGILTHEKPTASQNTQDRKSPAADNSAVATTKPAAPSKISKATAPAVPSALPPLPDQYEPKDADPTAAAHALSIGDYPTALRHYHALDRTYPNTEAFQVIVNVLRKRVQAPTKTK